MHLQVRHHWLAGLQWLCIGVVGWLVVREPVVAAQQ